MKFYMGFENTPIPLSQELLYREIPYCMAKEGFALRALDAVGSSDLFLRGIEGEKDKAIVQTLVHDTKSLSTRPLVKNSFYCVGDLPNYDKAVALLESKLIGFWKELSETEKRQGVLLIYQFLGVDLETPCDTVFCFYDPEGEHTYDWFLSLARDHGAKLINLADERSRHRVEDYVMEKTLF